MHLTKFQLFALLTTKGDAFVKLPDGRIGILQSVERESSSGASFNVRVRVGRQVETIYVRTVD